MYIRVDKKVANICGKGIRQGNRSCSVMRAKDVSKLNPWTNLRCPAVPTGTITSKRCLFRCIRRKHSVLHRSPLYSFRTLFSLFLGEAIIRDFRFCKQQKSTWTWHGDSAHASTSPESCRSHPHLTFPRSQPHQSQLQHHRLTPLPFSSSKTAVSIKSNKPVPDASFFHHSFQTMLSSNQSHLYLLHKAMRFTYMSLCYGEDKVHPRHI